MSSLLEEDNLSDFINQSSIQITEFLKEEEDQVIERPNPFKF